MRKNMLIALGVIVAITLAVAPAHATPLTPGGAVIAPTASFGPNTYSGGTVQNSYVNEAPVFAALITGTLTTEVIKEAGGTLDFLYQLTAGAANTSDIHRVTATSFGNATITTDVQYGPTPGPPFSTVTAPVMYSADRSVDGSTIGWTFAAGTSGGVGAGLESYVLIVKTNATQYVTGSTFAIDGGIMDFNSFAPKTSSVLGVPEPSSIVLAGIGALGLIGYGLRRRKAQGA